MAVTETGYPAQDFAINFAGIRLEFDTDPTKQALWMEYLLASAQEHELEFVVNFRHLRDYDAVGGGWGVAKSWRSRGATPGSTTRTAANGRRLRSGGNGWCAHSRRREWV